MVSLELLLQTYQFGSVTDCWRVDIQQVSAAYYTSAVFSDSVVPPEVQALLNEYVDVFQALFSQLPECDTFHYIPLCNEGMPPPKLRQFCMS